MKASKSKYIEYLAREIAAAKRGLTLDHPTIDRVWPSYVGQVRVIANKVRDIYNEYGYGLPKISSIERRSQTAEWKNNTELQLADEIEQLVSDTKNEQDDIDFYHGGSKKNISEENLTKLILANHGVIIRALKKVGIEGCV